MTKDSPLAGYTSTLKEMPPSLLSKKEILQDYAWCRLSREISIIARREVLTGKAKFGITGDGKELAQVALAKFLRPGDFRSGYYRDQTLMFALQVSTPVQFFAQLYADTENDPFSGGRQMNAHFATPLVDADGKWKNHLAQFNTSSDISSTAGQMARALGLAQASKLYRSKPDFDFSGFSQQGDEICVCTIGDASTSEGVFWETLNAAGVLQVPLVVAVWDDGYGISVPKALQTVKSSISEALSGFEKKSELSNGIKIFKANAWDYVKLLNIFEEGIHFARKTHTPVLFHIEETTQPQGHSTSGSHERYKSKERMQWEKEYDCIKKMEEWIIQSKIATWEELQEIQEQALKDARNAKDLAWKESQKYPLTLQSDLLSIYSEIPKTAVGAAELISQLEKLTAPLTFELIKNARRMFFLLNQQGYKATDKLTQWISNVNQTAEIQYDQHLFAENEFSAKSIPPTTPVYSSESKKVNGYQIINAYFDQAFNSNPHLVAFGEDLGVIGDVNQGFAGLQKKFGEKRIFDTGIREQTIMGQALGLAMRGFRPIAEIQYLDYLIYGLQTLTDDLATLRWRSNGIQQAPVIIRSRGHRLEGIWHSGSPMGMIIHALRGIHVCVPRNFTQAAGMYNTLLASNDPGLVIECLNGYRLKETMPDNLSEIKIPLGQPEILSVGHDVTLVTYGSCVRIAQEALDLLKNTNISVELIDVQTLLPFDIHHSIVNSLKKTNRILFLDEDVPGGASAFMMREVMEIQRGYHYLDAAPVTITAKEHRPPYGSDGDYFSKPNAEDVYEQILKMMSE
jgi:pyruvate/2-oxoglutarate/acetoin dehydrogenase E1 component/TPP-dependent pyruvate/acetoin dehydrogenase alpha subunit